MLNPKSPKSNKSLHLYPEHFSTKNKKHSSLSKEISELQTYMEGISNVLAHLFSKQVSMPALPSLNTLKSLSPICADIKQKLKLAKSAVFSKRENLNESSREIKFKKVKRPELNLNRNQSDPALNKLNRHKKNIIRPENSLIDSSTISKTLERDSSSVEVQKPNNNTTFFFNLSRLLINKVRELKVKKKYYSQFYKEFSIIIKQNRSHMMKIVHAKYGKSSTDKLRVAFKAVFAMVCIQNLGRKNIDCLNLCGINLNIDNSVRKDPFISSFISVLAINESNLSQKTWKAFMYDLYRSDEIRSFSQQINDFTSIIELLVTDNSRHKSRYLGLIEKYQELDLEKNKLLSLVETMAPYIKQLEDSKDENSRSKDYQTILGELEAHKKTLKALTIQYNALDKEKTEIQQRYELLLGKTN